ncbi:hypothetical protein AB6E53_02340 [Vibrio breoganii]|uniref:Uncharacterized protein n=1 Tax=Vibrio breoganii TaxID=553239 RepID=A0AAP8SWN2_9VIBR|nr:hypothetical protein [Vibrio breoganii]PMP10226.1 hypothetical protein BCS93_11160 [Vibrio breoganii]
MVHLEQVLNAVESQPRQAVMTRLMAIGLEVADASLFYGRENSGIWIRQSTNRLADQYLWECQDKLGTEGKLSDLVAGMGWFIEPYDRESMFVYKV